MKRINIGSPFLDNSTRLDLTWNLFLSFFRCLVHPGYNMCTYHPWQVNWFGGTIISERAYYITNNFYKRELLDRFLFVSMSRCSFKRKCTQHLKMMTMFDRWAIISEAFYRVIEKIRKKITTVRLVLCTVHNGAWEWHYYLECFLFV